MNVNFFLDTNIIIYALGNNVEKKEISIKLIEQKPVISTQVINELANICIKKLRLDLINVGKIITNISESCSVSLINNVTIQNALKLAKSYHFSYFDSLILASALESECKIIYSEDLQHNQLINKRLRIINPFIK